MKTRDLRHAPVDLSWTAAVGFARFRPRSDLVFGSWYRGESGFTFCHADKRSISGRSEVCPWAHARVIASFPWPRWETVIKMPNVNCPKCTLQVIQFMADHPYNQPGLRLPPLRGLGDHY